MRHLTQACAIAALCGLWPPSAAGQDVAPMEDAIAQARSCVEARAHAIAALLPFVDDGEVFTRAAVQAGEVAQMLGRLRAEEAVPILAEHIDFEPAPSWRRPGFADFPCAVALVRIGSAAAPQMVKLIAAGDEDALWLAIGVLAGVDGGPLARARLRLAAESELDEARKLRLLEAADVAARTPPAPLERTAPSDRGPQGPQGPHPEEGRFRPVGSSPGPKAGDRPQGDQALGQ